MQRKHLGAPFVVHQEIQDGPRFVREKLLAVEHLKNSNEYFSLVLDNENSSSTDEDALALLRHNPQTLHAVHTLDAFGPVIARLALVSHTLLVGDGTAHNHVCFRVQRLFAAVAPLVIAQEQWTVLTAPDPNNKDDASNSGTSSTSNTRSHPFGPSSHADISLLDAHVQLITIKAFPQNTLVRAEWLDAVNGAWSLVSSFALLPEDELEKRRSSDHVGYFASSIEITTASSSRDETHPFVLPHTEQFIHRYRLDASTHERIVFYIDPSVPMQWHATIQAGVTLWSSAFTGLVAHRDAVVCVAPHDAAFPSDFHAADIRYNAILWYPVDKESYSITHSITDPRSGEVLSSKIFMDAGHVLDILNALALARVVSASEGEALDDSEDSDVGLAASAVEWSLQRPVSESERSLRDPDTKAERSSTRRALSACVQMIVAHEVGHALGLRHNFLGSTQSSWRGDGNRVFADEHGLSSSLMDYLPVNIRSHNSSSNRNQTLCQTRIGRYDQWAIAYGYTPALNGSALKELASQRLPFASDEDASANLSYVQQFDLGAEPLDFFHDRLALVAQAQSRLERVTQALYFVKHDRSDRMWAAERVVLGLVVKALAGMSKFVGGKRSVWDDVYNHARVVPVAHETQWRALRHILEVVSLERVDVLPRHEHFDAFLENDNDDCGIANALCLGGHRADVYGYILETIVAPSLEGLLDRRRLEDLLADEEKDDAAGGRNDTLSLTTLLDCSAAYIWRFDSAWNCPLRPLHHARDTSRSSEYSPALLRAVQQLHLTRLMELRESSSMLAAPVRLVLEKLERAMDGALDALTTARSATTDLARAHWESMLQQLT